MNYCIHFKTMRNQATGELETLRHDERGPADPPRVLNERYPKLSAAIEYFVKGWDDPKRINLCEDVWTIVNTGTEDHEYAFGITQTFDGKGNFCTSIPADWEQEYDQKQLENGVTRRLSGSRHELLATRGMSPGAAMRHTMEQRQAHEAPRED